MVSLFRPMERKGYEELCIFSIFGIILYSA